MSSDFNSPHYSHRQMFAPQQVTIFSVNNHLNTNTEKLHQRYTHRNLHPTTIKQFRDHFSRQFFKATRQRPSAVFSNNTVHTSVHLLRDGLVLVRLREPLLHWGWAGRAHVTPGIPISTTRARESTPSTCRTSRLGPQVCLTDSISAFCELGSPGGGWRSS